MKILHQILRQPLKSIAGVVVVSLAVAALCVCLGQSIVADKTEAQMEYHFTTVALPTSKYNYEERVITAFDGSTIRYTYKNRNMPESVADVVNGIVEAHPELVETVATPGLASAYVPELKPDNEVNHLCYPYNVQTSEGRLYHDMQGHAPYASAMLEVVLEEIGEPTVYTQVAIKNGEPVEDGTDSCVYEVRVELKATIKSVVSLQEAYEDPTGRTIWLSMAMPDSESLEALNLTVGERYLVYGHDYVDGNWELKGFLTDRFSYQVNTPIEVTELDESAISYYTEQEQELHKKLNPYSSIPIARYYYYPEGQSRIFTILFENTMKLYNSVSLSLKDTTLLGDYTWIDYADGSGKYAVMKYDRFITDENGNEVQITQEEYRARYAIPTIAHLTGSVAEFLQSEDGALWAQKLAYMQVNDQAFPVIGVEKLGYIAEFARETARIVDGRDFTAEELASGAKVCVIAESLAVANGLQVGDTISPRFYNYDRNDPHQGLLEDGRGLIDPVAYRFTANTEWAGEAEQYTIIGLYRQDNAWGNVANNLYSFTPNTIFAPKASITSDMSYGSMGVFNTLVLKNGAIGEFRALVEEAGYPDLFVFYDQGYTEISSSLQNYKVVARRVLLVGVVVYGVILALFLLFFPGSQGKTIWTMRALGAPRKTRMAQVFASSAGILIPGTLIGMVCGMLLWQRVIAAIASGAGTMVSLEMDIASLAIIAAVQLLAAFVFTALVALPLTRDKGLANRR